MFRSTVAMNTPAGGSNSLTDKLSEYKLPEILHPEAQYTKPAIEPPINLFRYLLLNN